MSSVNAWMVLMLGWNKHVVIVYVVDSEKLVDAKAKLDRSGIERCPILLVCLSEELSNQKSLFSAFL